MPTRTWTGATNNNWNTSTNWAEGFVPTNLDDVVFSTNVNCSVTSAAVCKTITFGTYSGTFTNTGGLTVSGNVSLGASVVWGTFTSALVVDTTATLTSNGKDIPYLRFLNTITVTFADNWTVTANLYFPNVSMTLTLNGNNIYVSGGTISHLNGCTVNGTTTINITGTVNWNAAGSTAYISNPITINTAGTFTLSDNFYLSGNTVTWIAGTMVVTGSNTALSGNVTFTGTGLSFNNITALTNTTLTLSNDITITGNLSGGGSAATFVINGFNLYIGAGLSTTVNTVVSGTTKFILNGTGTIGTASASGSFQNDIEINTTGTITLLSGSFRYRTGTFKYTTGTTINTGNTFLVQGTTTLDFNGMVLNTLNISGGTFTVTLLSNITCTLISLQNVPTVNGFKIFTESLSCNATTGGTTTYEFYGNGTWTGVTGYLGSDVTINSTSTIMTGALGFRTGTLKWLAGTTDTTGSTMTVGAAATIDVNGNTEGTGSAICDTGINFWNFTDSHTSGTLTFTTPICVINSFSLVQGPYGASSFAYVQGNLIAANNTGGTLTIVLNGSGFIQTNSALRSNLVINTNGKYTVGTTNTPNLLRMNTATFTYIKGKIDTRNITLTIAATSTFIGFDKLRFKRVEVANQLTMDEFFQGSASQICQVVSSLLGTAFTLVLTSGFQKVSHYTSIQDMTLTNTATSRGSLLLTYSKANKGRNTGNITYVNNKPNGIIDYVDTVKSLETMAGVQLQGDPAYN